MKLVYLSAAFLLGVFAASRLEPPGLPFLIAAAALAPVLSGLIIIRKRPAALCAAAALLLAFGLARAASDVPSESALHPYMNLPQTQVRGIIDSYPVPRDGLSQFLFDVEAVNIDGTWAEVSESVLVRARPTPELVGIRDLPYFRYGDSLRLTGTLETPPVLGDFDWRDHLAQEGVHSIMFRPEVVYLQDGQGFPLMTFLFDLRARLARSLGRTLPEPQASLSQAMALGLRGTLPTELKEDLARTGTTHMVAISGLHVGTVVGMAGLLPRFLFGRGRGREVFVALLLLVWGYALLTGLAPPVMRAAIMGSIFLWATYLGRQRSALPALAAAAAVMVLIDPGSLDEVSFQLSFLAMAGLILLAPWFRVSGRALVSKFLPSEGTAAGLGVLAIDATAISLAAILATLPVIAFNFQQVALVGLPATLAILPVLPFILGTSLLVGFAGLVSSALAQGLGWAAWPWLTYMAGAVELFAWAPSLSVDAGPASTYLVWAYYGVAAALLWLLNRKRGRWVSRLGDLDSAWPDVPHSVSGSGGAWRFAPLLLVIPVILFVSVGLSQPSDRLRVTFLDVGQGDAILVQSPSQKTVLIDGGPSPAVLALEIGQRLPPWERELDLVMLTHPDRDHLAGLLELITRYDVGLVVQCGLDCATEGNLSGYRSWRTVLDREGIGVIEAERDQIIDLKDGARILVLHPPPNPLSGTESDGNNNSVVLLLSYGDVAFLLPGDIEAFAERFLVRYSDDLSATVLKVPHHGSRTSTTAEFLAAVDPLFAVISAGADNPFGHPHPQTLATLREQLSDAQILLTSEHGSIRFETDGSSLWLSNER